MFTTGVVQKIAEPDFTIEKQIISNLKLSSLAATKSDPEMSRYFAGYAETKEVLLEQKRREFNSPKMSRRDLRKLKKMRFKPNFDNSTDDYDGENL